MYKGESTSGGNEGSFTLFTCPKSIDGSHIEEVIIVGLEVNLQLQSFNSRERSKYKGRIVIFNIMPLLNDSSYFNPMNCECKGGHILNLASSETEMNHTGWSEHKSS